MLRKTLILALFLSSLIFWSSLVKAQDPNDPVNPDTVWIYRVPMADTWNIFMNQALPFTVVCSVWVDEVIWGISVPLVFYHSQNRDIICDSIVWGDSVTSPPAVDGRRVENDSVPTPTKTVKLAYVGGLWFTSALPQGSKQHLFTAYFNGDHTQVPAWDTTKSIMLDSTTVQPGFSELILTDENTVTFYPIFHHAVIGDTAVISGTAYKDDGTTPDTGVYVYCKGKDVTTNPDTFPGRVFFDKSDAL